MKISESQKKERLAKAEAEAKQKEQEYLTWFKELNLLTDENRKYLIYELLSIKERQTEIWETLKRDKDKNISNWKSYRSQMFFQTELLDLQIKKIREVLINNKF
tara:strand:+ start:1879 stop:2190 length:312 start_codon:yes stop_codon:yes gene_type:complete